MGWKRIAVILFERRKAAIRRGKAGAGDPEGRRIAALSAERDRVLRKWRGKRADDATQGEPGWKRSPR